jgi:hypothetical protein
MPDHSAQSSVPKNPRAHDHDIATEQTKATEKTQAAANQLLDYLVTHPDATIRYHKSEIILHIHSDAYYL